MMHYNVSDVANCYAQTAWQRIQNRYRTAFYQRVSGLVPLDECSFERCFGVGDINGTEFARTVMSWSQLRDPAQWLYLNETACLMHAWVKLSPFALYADDVRQFQRAIQGDAIEIIQMLVGSAAGQLDCMAESARMQQKQGLGKWELPPFSTVMEACQLLFVPLRLLGTLDESLPLPVCSYVQQLLFWHALRQETSLFAAGDTAPLIYWGAASDRAEHIANKRTEVARALKAYLTRSFLRMHRQVLLDERQWLCPRNEAFLELFDIPLPAQEASVDDWMASSDIADYRAPAQCWDDFCALFGKAYMYA